MENLEAAHSDNLDFNSWREATFPSTMELLEWQDTQENNNTAEAPTETPDETPTTAETPIETTAPTDNNETQPRQESSPEDDPSLNIRAVDKKFLEFKLEGWDLITT